MTAAYPNPNDPDRAQRLERPQHTLHRAATEQTKRYVTRPFRCAELHAVSHRICEEAPDAAELVPDHNGRAG